MIFNVEVKTDGEVLKRGDLVYDKRKLLRVVRVNRAQYGGRLITVKLRTVGKINLDRELRADRAKVVRALG